MTKDEALRLAWDALQQIAHVSAMDYEYQQWAVEAITAIKEALAQTEQEPVGDFYITKDMAEHIKNLEVAWTICASGSKRPTEKKVVPVFVGNTTPPQRTWVGLTQEELSEIYNRTEWDTVNVHSFPTRRSSDHRKSVV